MVGSCPPQVSDEEGDADEEDARDAADAPAPARARAATLLLLTYVWAAYRVTHLLAD